MDTLFDLSGLDSIDWSSLEHAYGEADGTSEDLKALTAADQEIQMNAVGQLEMSICHQGSLYTATAAAVPFLLTAAEHMYGESKSYLLELIASIGESAVVTPGGIAKGICMRFRIWPNLAEQPNPKETVISEINTYSSVLKALANDIDRLSSLITEIRPELPQKILKSSQYRWSGDILDYVMSLPYFSAGIAQTVLSEPVSLSYQSIAEKLDATTLSGAILWWALQEELASDEHLLFKDSLARDLNENLPEGCRTDEMYYEFQHFYWNPWLLKFWDKFEQALKAKQHIELNAVLGWLPQSREDKLIREATEIALGTDHKYL